MHHQNRVNRLIRKIGMLEEQRRDDRTILGAQLLFMAKTIRKDFVSLGCREDRIAGVESIVLEIEDCFGLLDWFDEEYPDADPFKPVRLITGDSRSGDHDAPAEGNATDG